MTYSPMATVRRVLELRDVPDGHDLALLEHEAALASLVGRRLRRRCPVA
jgi:hypothetical protein